MDTAWWSTERVPRAIPASRRRRALASSSASEVQTWGQADSNRVDVWSENGKPTRMTARVDVRRLEQVRRDVAAVC